MESCPIKRRCFIAIYPDKYFLSSFCSIQSKLLVYNFLKRKYNIKPTKPFLQPIFSLWKCLMNECTRSIQSLSCLFKMRKLRAKKQILAHPFLQHFGKNPNPGRPVFTFNSRNEQRKLQDSSHK